MPRRALLLLLVGSLAVLAAWVLWSPARGEDAAGRTTAAVMETPEGADAEPPRTGGAAEVGAEREALPSGAEEPAPEPEFAEPYAGEDALTIEVFDTTTGRLAPGAVVHYVDRGGWDEATREEAWRLEDTWTGIALRYGTRYRCGDDGRVQVPPRTGHATVAAMVGDRRGSLGTLEMPGGGAETLRVEVRPIRALAVQVLRADGSPAPDCGVAVASLMGGGQFTLGRTVRTDAEGMARFDYLEEQDLARRGLRPHVAVYEPLAEPLRRELQPDAWPAEPVRFTLPPTGVVEVAAVTPDGSPMPAGGAVWLSRFREEERADLASTNWMMFHLGTGSPRQLDADGVARFPYVAAGMPLKMLLTRTADYGQAAAVADRPAEAGRTVRLELGAGEPASHVTLRVLDPRRQPLAGVQLVADTACGEHAERRIDGRWVTTDADGAIRIRVDEELFPPDTPRWLVVAENQAVDRWRARVHRVPLPAGLAPGDNPLGELVLGGREVAGGVVVDSAGAPVSDVHLSLMVRDGERNQRLAWAQTTADGRFLFDCATPAQGLFLSLQPPETYLEQELELPAPQLDLRVELAAGTALSGRLLLPEGAAGNLLRVEAHAVDGGWSQTGWDHDGDGAFRIEHVPPGVEFELRVESYNDAGPVFTRRYLLGPGEQAAPEELNPLDLRDLVHHHRLEVLREDGSAPPSCQVTVALPDGKVQGSGRPNSNLFETLSTLEELDLVAAAPGCLPKRLTLRGAQTVRLAPGPRATLDLTLPALPEGQVLVLTLTGSFDAGLSLPVTSSQDYLFEASEVREVQLPGSGSFRVRLTLQPRHRMGREVMLGVPTEAAFFEATPGARYELTVPPELLEGLR